MSKILSLIGFTILLVWSWNSVQSASKSTHLSTHSQIQSKLSEIIKQTLQTKKPNAQNITILKIWTAYENQHKIKANFTYKYNEITEASESAEQVVSGEAFLYNEPSEDKTTEKWILQSVRTLNEAITFTEGVVISPDTEVPAELNTTTPINESTTPTAQPPAEPKQSH